MAEPVDYAARAKRFEREISTAQTQREILELLAVEVNNSIGYRTTWMSIVSPDREFVRVLAPEFSGGEDLKGTLYLNASCPLLRRLAERPPKGEALGCVLTLLHQVARLFAGRMLSASDAVDAFREMTRSVEGLLR